MSSSPNRSTTEPISSGWSRHSSSSAVPSWIARSPVSWQNSMSRSHSPGPKSYVKMPRRGQSSACGSERNTDRAKARSRPTSSGGPGGVSRTSQPSYPISPRAARLAGQGTGALPGTRAARCEVDAAQSGRAVARLHAGVLEVQTPDELAERSDLGGGVHAARDRVGQIEIATERARADPFGERENPLRGKRALVAERDAALARRFPQRPER